MPLTQAWEPSCPSKWKVNCIRVPFSPVVSHRLSRITTWVIVTYWPLSWPWRNGSNGWWAVSTWMDHKNLAYLQAKRLNARQARWALFFTRFSLTITYRPGSRNTKPGRAVPPVCATSGGIGKGENHRLLTAFHAQMGRLKYVCGVLFMFLLPFHLCLPVVCVLVWDVHVSGRKCSCARVSHTCRSSATASCSRLPSLAMSLINRVAELQLMLDR